MRTQGHIIDAIKGKAILAPMLATTDIPFRIICRTFGAALTLTEMVSAAGILRESPTSFRNAVFSPDEHPIGIQLVAADADTVAAAARELRPFKPDLFDINCGCPNDRICEVGAGAQLLDDLPRMTRLLSAASEATTIPVSAKIRMRGHSRLSNVRDIARAAEDGGVAMITVHARVRHARYDVAAQWDSIAEAVNSVDIPVVGNGDIFSSADAQRMMRETGCWAVMVARGALGTPWIFRDIADGYSCDIQEHAPDTEEMTRLVCTHMQSMIDEFGSIRAIPRMRKHAMWYSRNFAGMPALRHQLFSQQDPHIMIEEVCRFFRGAPPHLAQDDPLREEIELRFRKRVLFWVHEIMLTEG
ncbi:MAG: tRNA-dihydrouridine synthase [Bacteroidetes bacterium]|nr:tRNA-dihydrouridine synthase [Bacteroidota bacterium]